MAPTLDAIPHPRERSRVLDPRRARLLALAAVAGLALTACTDDAPPPADPTTSPSPTEARADVPSLATRCTLQAPQLDAVDRVAFAVPDGWQVEESSCEFFDPVLEALGEGTEPDAALGVRISDADFATAAAPGGEIQEEVLHVGARSGRQAVRVRAESTGEGLRPEGQPVLRWLVDLDPGTDEQGGTLVMAATSSSGADFDRAAAALDRVAQTIRVVPAAVEDGPVVVTRMEGGGAPWTVTHDRDDGCFRLRPGGPTDEPVDEACDVAPAEDGIAGAVLTDGDLAVVAGIAPPLAVLVESEAADAPSGAITTPVEGGSLFAYPSAGGAPVDLRAVDADGRSLTTATIG